MLIEMHCHSSEHSSCSRVSAVELVRQVCARGLQGLVLTDHHYLWAVEELRELGIAAAIPSYFLILSGQEVTTPDFGDILVYGATEQLRFGTPAAEIRARFPSAALVWAHPYRSGRRPSESQLQHPVLDAVEIFNSNHTARENTRGLEDWHRLKFTAIGGSDTHAGTYAGIYPTDFHHPFSGIGGLAEEIRSGRCHPALKEVPRYGENTTVTELRIGIGGGPGSDCLILKSAARDEKWQAAHRAFHIMDVVYRSGFSSGKFRVPRPIEEDVVTRTVIEQEIDGESLHDLLETVSPAEGRELIALTGQWLARLHATSLQVTPPRDFLGVEEKRLSRYVEYFEEAEHPHTAKAQALSDVLREEERDLVGKGRVRLVQGHGDFHPKNIYVGWEDRRDSASRYIAAFDFDSSYSQPRAFDVGYFLAQLRTQFFHRPDILSRYPESLFLESYLSGAGGVEEDFPGQVVLFRARTLLNIASFLVWIGKGDTPDVWRLLVEAEQAVASWQAHSLRR